MDISKHLVQLSKEKDVSKRLLVYCEIEKEEYFRFPNGRSQEKILSNVQTISLLQIIVVDLSSCDDEMIRIALSVVGNIFANEKLQLQLEDEIINELLQQLVDIVASTKSNSIMQRVLHILSVQHFSKTVLSLFVESLLVAVPVWGCSIGCGYIGMVNKFLEQCPDDMNEHICLWIKTVLQLSCHDQAITRQQAVTTMKENLKIILNNKKKILSLCANLLKSELLPKLKSLANKTEIHREVLSCQLPIYMSIIGEDYKRSSSLSNLMLQFLEKGFCHSEEQIKICAFKAWSCLIECFSSNKELLASPKYCKLFTQPLKLKLKSEALTRALIESMWKLAVCLDDVLPELFEAVCIPLLELCFGGPKTMQLRRSSGRLSLSKHLSRYESIQVLGAEMLARFLLATTQQLNHEFTLEPLHKPFFSSPPMFARFHSTFLPTICDTICHLNKLLPAEFLWELWNVVLKCTQDTVSRKRDVEMFKSLYQTAHRIVKADFSARFLLSVVESLTTFPSKILNSSLYYFSDTAVGVMHGTPVITMLQLLLSPQVCKDNLINPKFFDCAKSIIACGMERQIATLEFIRSVIKHLSTDDVVFLKMWIFLSDEVTKYMLKTLNVNEGDSFEHDFSTLYEALVYPFFVVFNSKICLDASTTEKALYSWSNMFDQFVSCATKIPTAKPNEARHHIATQLLNSVDSSQDSVLQETQLQFFEVACLKIVTGTDFTQVEANPWRSSRSKSFKKLSKSEVISENCLEGFNFVLGQLLCCEEKKSSVGSNIIRLPSIMPCLYYIFSNTPQSLVMPFFLCFSEILPKYMRQVKSLPKHVVLSIEETWHQILLRLVFENSLFSDGSISELFVVAISQSSEAMYQSCVEFWKLKVLDSLDVSELPEEFLDILDGMYKKEGFSITWKEQDTDNEEIDLNVSVASDQSAAEEKVETGSESAFAEQSNTSSDFQDDIILDDDTEEDDDITQLDRYRTTLESTSCESFSDAVDDMSIDETNKESHNHSLSLRPFANDVISERKLSNHHAEDKFREEQLIQQQSERLNPLINNESDKKIDRNDVVSNTKGPSSADSEVATATSMNISSSAKRNPLYGNDFVSEDEDSETSCLVISDSEEDANNASCIMIKDCQDQSFQSASEELITEEVSSSADTKDPAPLDGSVYNNANVSVGSNYFSTGDQTLNESSSGSVQEAVNKCLDNDIEEPDALQEDSCENQMYVTSVNEAKAEDSVYEEIEMVDSSLHPAQEQSIALLVSGEICEQKDEDMEEVYVEMVEVSVFSDPSSVEDSSVANEHFKNFRNTSLVCDGTECPDESVYEIVEVGEMSINTETQLEVSALEERAAVCSAGSTQQSPSKLHTAITVPSPQNKPDLASTEKFIVHTETRQCHKPSTENLTCNVVSDESNSKQPTREFVQADHKIVTLNDSFENCAQELGVEPLDSSFETQEQVGRNEDRALSSDSLYKTEDNRKTIEDVMTNSLKIDETDCSEVKGNSIVSASVTPRRCSTRKRISTSKPLSEVVNKRGRKAPLKLQCEVSAVERLDPIQPTSNSVQKAQIDSSDLSATNDGDKVTIHLEKHLTNSENVVPDPVVPLENLDSWKEQNHIDIDKNLPDMTLNKSKVVSNTETDLKSSENDKIFCAIPETNMMDSPQSSEKPEEEIVTPRSCLGKRLNLLRSGEEISPIGSPNSILKKRLTDTLSPVTKPRRVSFAEPISTSTICERETVVQFPASSPKDWKKTKSSHRVVSRRLSLPAPQRATAVVEPPSPMSVRSVKIAAAIADIKARGTTENSTLNHSLINSPSTNPNSPRKSSLDVGTLHVSQLNNSALLKSLSAEQLSDLMEHLLEASPIIHSILMRKIKNL